MLKAFGSLALVGGLAGCAGGSGDEDSEPNATETTEATEATENAHTSETPAETDTPADEETETEADDEPSEGGGARVEFVHASPDAPDVVALVDGSAATKDLTFGDVGDAVDLEPGSHDVRIVEATDGDAVLFEEEVTLDGAEYTAVALGEVAEGASNPFAVEFLEDETGGLGDGESRLRIVHASPDAPAVDVTEDGGDVLFEDVSFGDAPDTELAADEYSLEVRRATSGNDGTVAETYDVDVSEPGAYTAFALGYLMPGGGGESFDLNVVRDDG